MKVRLLVALLMVIFLCSCAQTKDLWENSKYVEHITHILSTEDGTKIVIVGEKYHYVFINQHVLSELLKWQDKDILEFKFNENFNINPDSIVTGNYTVACKCNNSNPEQIKWLLSNGFHQDKENKLIYSRVDSISGKMYLSRNIDLSKYARIKGEYKITIESRHSFDILAKIVFTPVAIINDVGTAMIYGSALIIASPFIAFDNLANENK